MAVGLIDGESSMIGTIAAAVIDVAQVPMFVAALVLAQTVSPAASV